jgi:hypothetical protein
MPIVFPPVHFSNRNGAKPFVSYGAAAVGDRDYNFGQAASSVRKLATNAIGWSIIT